MNPLRWRILSLAVAGALLGAGYLWAVFEYGSYAGLRQRLAGHRLILANPFVEFAVTAQGDAKLFKFLVRNCSTNPVRLLGMSNTCGCITTEAFPVTIPAGEWREIIGRIRPTAPGRQVRDLEMYSDDLTASRLLAAIAITGAESIPSSKQGES